MLSNLNIFILTGYYKVTRAGELDSHSPSTNAASLSRPRPHFSLSSSTHNRQQHSDEAEELLFEGNVSSDALGSSSHHLTRFREGSFDIEMSGTNHLGHGREREGYERY